jgi:hypothetical protein
MNEFSEVVLDAKNNEPANKQVLNAFNHVEQFFPGIFYLVIGFDSKWNFMYEDFESPNFKGVDIDVSLLEEMVDSLDYIPALFYKKVPEND